MNKGFIFRTIVCTLAVIFSACSSDELVEQQTSGKQITMTASDFIYENGSRTSIDVSSDGGAFKWSENDTVGIFPNEGGQVYFPMTNGVGTNTAYFNGGGWALKPSASYAAYYPFVGNMYLDKTKIPVSYEGQVQIGNASTAHLGQFDYMVAKATTPEKGEVLFNFEHLGALVELTIDTQYPEVSKLELTADSLVFVTRGTMDATAEQVTFSNTEKSNSLSISLKDVGQLSKNTPLKVYMMLPPADFSATPIHVRVMNLKGGFEEFSVPFKVLEAGKAYKIKAVKVDDSDEMVSPMILTVKAYVGNDFKVELPLVGYFERSMNHEPHGLDCKIDWGDGTVEHFVDEWPISHTYSCNTPTFYEVKVSGKVYGLSSDYRDSDSYSYYRIQNHGIREVKQWGDLGLQSMHRAFTLNNELVKLADDTSGAFKNVSWFDEAFSNCESLTEIPAGLFAHSEKADDFSKLFYGCNSLKTLPAGLFDHCISATTFEKAFNYCENLVSLPANLFKGCSNVTSFNGTFGYCGKLDKLPGDLFKNCVSATNFIYTFYSCTALKSIPSELFQDCSKATFFDSVFGNCGSLVSIPAGLFDHCKEATYFADSFGYCTKLETIPEGLFSNCAKVTDFSGVFSCCDSLKEVPARLFENCKSAKDFSGVFKKCYSIKSIPKDLFKGCTKAEELDGAFDYCRSLESIPEHLFDDSPKISILRDAFYGCTSLTSVPCNLFDYTFRISNLNNTFGGCEKLSGESPYTVLNGVKYHLYERGKNPDYFINPDGGRCFYNCTKLSDYDAIPYDWK